MNVLIVPDKFKGTLTAEKAAEAIAPRWRTLPRKPRLDRSWDCRPRIGR